MKTPLKRRPRRVFDKTNKHWNNLNRRRNQLYVRMMQEYANDLLRYRGYVSLNDVFDLLGFERTVRGGQQGWFRSDLDDVGDGYIEFGIWAEGFERAKAWLRGEVDMMTLYFNVDPVMVSMPRRIKKLQEEGKLPSNLTYFT